MFTALGHLIVRRRKSIIATTMIGLVVAIGLGIGVFGELSNGGFDDPNSESVAAADLLQDEFDTGGADLVAVVTAESGSVDDPAVAAVGAALTADLAAAPGTDDVASYWSLGAPPPLRSEDGTRALILVRFPGEVDDAARAEHVEAVLADYDGLERDGVRVDLAGREAVFTAIGETIEGDLARAESIAIPLTLLLLLVVFGSAVAAGLPVLVGMISVFGAFFVLYVITLFTDVSIFSINLVTALGLGLAIDYSLFIVSRFREELDRGRNGRRRGRPHGRNGRTNGGVQCDDRRDLAQCAADLPALLPAIVRLRRDRRAARRDADLGRVPAGAARGARSEGRRRSGLQAPQQPRRRRWMAPVRDHGDASTDPGRRRRRDPAGRARAAVPRRRVGHG